MRAAVTSPARLSSLPMHSDVHVDIRMCLLYFYYMYMYVVWVEARHGTESDGGDQFSRVVSEWWSSFELMVHSNLVSIPLFERIDNVV